MGNAPEVAFTEIEWDQEAIKHLRLIDGMRLPVIQKYAQAVKSGERVLVGIYVNGRRIGSLIWSLEDECGKRVFSLDEVGAMPADEGAIADSVATFANEIAKTHKADLIRVLTARPGLVRLYRDGWKVSYVLEREPWV